MLFSIYDFLDPPVVIGAYQVKLGELFDLAQSLEPLTNEKKYILVLDCQII